MVLFLLGWLLW